MPIRIEPPPRGSSIAAIERWLEKLYAYVRPSTQLVADANANIGTGIRYVGVTVLTSSRTLTLPPAAEIADGEEIVVQDESGAAGTHNVVIQRAGTDTINAGTSVSITSNHGIRRLRKRGAGKFFSA